MSRTLTASLLALPLAVAISGSALAQSYNAPAGIPAATAPGGLEGAAASGNLNRYERRFERPGTVSVEGVYTTGSVNRVRPAR